MTRHPRLSNKKCAAVILIFILFMVFRYMFPEGNALSKMQIAQFQSEHNLRSLSLLVLKYKKEHHGIDPQSLTGLIVYLEGSLELFNAPGSRHPLSVNQSIAPDKIDEYSAYKIARNPNVNIVAFEKSGLWMDDSIAVAYTNGIVKRLPKNEFARLGVDTKEQVQDNSLKH